MWFGGQLEKLCSDEKKDSPIGFPLQTRPHQLEEKLAQQAVNKLVK